MHRVHTTTLTSFRRSVPADTRGRHDQGAGQQVALAVTLRIIPVAPLYYLAPVIATNLNNGVNDQGMEREDPGDSRVSHSK